MSTVKRQVMVGSRATVHVQFLWTQKREREKKRGGGGGGRNSPMSLSPTVRQYPQKRAVHIAANGHLE